MQMYKVLYCLVALARSPGSLSRQSHPPQHVSHSRGRRKNKGSEAQHRILRTSFSSSYSSPDKEGSFIAYKQAPHSRSICALLFFSSTWSGPPFCVSPGNEALFSSSGALLCDKIIKASLRGHRAVAYIDSAVQD